MKKIKILLFGGEQTGWALDTDLALTRKSLETLPEVELVSSIKDAEVIHSVWEEPLTSLPVNGLYGKRIVCHACNDVMRLHEKPTMMRARRFVGLWVAQASKLKIDFDLLNIPSIHIPYSIDTTVFTQRPSSLERRVTLRKQFGLSADSFVISNFMRDTDGSNFSKPKEQKSPELFLQLVKRLAEKCPSVHVLIAGPRRHWLRSRLRENHIAFTFIGQETEHDDNKINILTAETINSLYHVSDLHLISSKWEGGPRSVLEAAATKTPVISTPVGIVEGLLPPALVYSCFDEGIKAIERFIENSLDSNIVEDLYVRIHQHHTPVSNQKLFADLYKNIADVPVFGAQAISSRRVYNTGNPVSKLFSKVSTTLARRLSVFKKPITIGLWHEFHKPPYGGGNQFMLALRAALERQGVRVVVNKINSGVDAHICNSAWFDTDLFERKSKEFPVRMIHRIDGPVTLYRGEGREVDDQIFSINKKCAAVTVFQSAYCYRESVKLGYKPVNPVIIHNSSNPEIFFTDKGNDSLGEGKIRIISSAWSDNPRKGGPLYKWLDENLDWDRYEYTFVGRVREQFDNINLVGALNSEKLAELLRNHDIFLSASQHEPCSNALIEALTCGLPTLYRDDGGNPELVGFGGVPFSDEKDVLAGLERLVKDYDSFRELIILNSIDEIAKRYLAVAQDLLENEI